MRRLLGFLGVLGALLTGSGCDDGGGSTELTRPTLVSADPARLSGASCGDQPGELATYVATLWDTTPFADAPGYPNADCEPSCSYVDRNNEIQRLSNEDCWAFMFGTLTAPEDCDPDACNVTSFVDCDWFELPSSAPVPCEVPVGFSFVAIGHHYVGRIAGYERADLEPLTVGSNVMTDPDTGAVVAPSWVWACTKPTPAVYNWDNPLTGCELIGAPAASAAGIAVAPAELLGGVLCGDSADRVSRLEVTLGGDAPTTQTIGCDEDAVFTARGDGSALVPGATYSLSVAAYALGAETPGWTTTCYGDCRGGVTVEARCDPLVPVD